jgi:site-specific DNA-methyltransferase (adenine-specific)
MADRSIGAVISDPPFFTGMGRPANWSEKSNLGSDPWNHAASVHEAVDWATPFMLEFRRIVRKGGAVVVMAGVHASAAWMQAAEIAGLVWMAELMVMWNSGKPRLSNFGSLHTHILWFTVPGARHEWNSTRKAIYSNLLVCKKVPIQHRHHPAQKPIELTNLLISLLTRRNDVVLDPFCGSGSTLVSAELCGRPFIGIDRESRNCNIAKRRVRDADVEEEEPIHLWCNGRLEEI